MSYSDYILRLSTNGVLLNRREFKEIRDLVQLTVSEATADRSLTEQERRNVLAECERNLGDLESEEDNHEAAQTHFKKALDLCTSSDHEVYLRTLGAIANNYLRQERFAEAIDYYQQVLPILEAKGIDVGIAATLSNIGVVHNEVGDYSKALEFYSRALVYAEKANHQLFVANINSNLGGISHAMGEDERAAYYHKTSVELYELVGDPSGLASGLSSLGNVHRAKHEYEQAIELYNKAIAISKQIGELSLVSMVEANLGGLYCDTKNYDEALRLMNQSLAYAEEHGLQRQLANACNNIAVILNDIKSDDDYLDRSEALLLRAIAINEHQQAKVQLRDNHDILSQVYEAQARWKEALHHRKLHQKLDSELRSDDAKRHLQNLDHQRKIEADERNRQVRLARFQEQEKILYNILPPVIAERVVAGERRIAESHNNVSILFADLVGFTKLSEQIGENELIDTLDEVFSTFDHLTEKHGCEKIKTIGDCYMAVCGMPEANSDHATLISALALDIRDCMSELSARRGHQLNIRIGIHCGPVVSGILGKNKYAYDVWGDAVNTAARMEAHGEAGKIHVSKEFVRSLSSQHTMQQPTPHPTPPQPSPEGEGATSKADSTSEKALRSREGLGGVAQGARLSFIARGEIDIKGKGKMRTYFLERV